MTAAALLAPPPVNSRRVSAGIAPADGATSRLPAWWGAEDWTAHEVPAALDERPELLRECHVSRDAVVKLARVMAAFADYTTGRDCRPTNARLVELCQCSLSTVQRARRVLERLGIVHRLIEGRSMMTRAERLAAWRRGSSHRNVAATFALLSRPRRAPKETTTRLEVGTRDHGADLRSVDGDTPPGAMRVSNYLQSRSGLLRRRTENEERRSAPRSQPKTSDGRPRRLAEGTRNRLRWLQGTPASRLRPLLTRFARAGWSPTDVELAAEDARKALGWPRVPADLRHPAAYLARLLRDVDHEQVRPSVEQAAHEAWLAEQAAAERAARRARVLDLAGRCPHGIPANGAGQPSRGVVACLACRRIEA